MRWAWCGLLSLLVVTGSCASGLPTALFDYIAATAGQASWEMGEARPLGSGSVTEVRLRSQVWRRIPWQHRLLICAPSTLLVEDVVLLFISGDPSPGDALLGLSLAELSGLRVAILSDVPNQPLFGGLREDALISYTFERYLVEGDPDWPLLFPMARSAVATMEALDGIAGEAWGVRLRGFVVTGASKRGWTTYLVAAAAPQRVLGIAPMVFDILNIPLQIVHQEEFWGELSYKIHDYTERGLTSAFTGSPEGTLLTWLVDPYTYRYAYTMPKLVILGTNDPYWPVDALNLYWPGLPDPKLALLVPNSGHGLDDRTRVTSSLVAFAHAVAQGIPLPVLEFSFSLGKAGLELRLVVDQEPMEARLWLAQSPVRDFRDAHWEEQALPRARAGWKAEFPRPEAGCLAVYAELVFGLGGLHLHVTTPARVLGP